MVRTLRFATVALLLGAGLLLPVLLRGQAPALPPPNGQPWGPGQTDSTSRKPSVIASTTLPPVSAPAKTTGPRPLPVPDDGLNPPAATMRPPTLLSGPPPRSPAQEMPQPLLEPVTQPLNLRKPEPLLPEPAGAGVIQLTSSRPFAVSGTEPYTLATTPGPAPAPSPIPAGPLQSGGPAGLSVEVLGPARITLHDILPCEIVVRNPSNQVLTQVRVELPLPTGLRFVTAAPMPETQADRLVWHLGVLEVRGERRLRTDLMVRALDDMALQPQASYQTGVALRPQVVRPTFAVEQLGPDVVPRGMTSTLQLQLTNHGAVPLNKVVLWDRLPAGLYHPQGTNIYAEVGRLAPGESRSVKLEILAHRAGRWVNEVIAEAEGGVRTVSRGVFLVAEPSLSVKVVGPEKVSVAGEVDFRLEVTNGRHGPSANNIRLVQHLPAGLEAVQATTNGAIDAGNRSVNWSLPPLEPGQVHSVYLKARCLSAGAWTTQVLLSADQLSRTQVDHTVLGEGGSRLQVTVESREDPLDVGGETVYEVRLTNLGAQPARNVRLSAWVPEGLAPVRGDGPGPARIQQQHVQFDALPQLEPRASQGYRLRFRGQRAGVWRLRLEGMAEQMARPAVEELPVQVLPDPRLRRTLEGMAGEGD